MGQAEERPGRRREAARHQTDRTDAARFRALADAAFEGVALTEDGVILEVNAALGALLGYAPAALRGRPVLELVAPEARDELARRAATGGGEPYRTVGLHRDGTRLELELRARSMRYDQRTVRVTAVRDVTPRTAGEREAREAETRYRRLFEDASDLILSVAPDGRFQYANPAWRRALGYSEAELATLSAGELVHPEDRARWPGLIARVLAGDDVGLQRVRLLTRSGAVLTAEGTVHRQVVGGRPVAVRAIFRDVTARAAAEAALLQTEAEQRAVLDAAGDAMLVVGPDRRIRFANRRFGELFAVDPAGLPGHDFHVFWPHTERVFADPEGLADLVRGTAADPVRRLEAVLKQRWPEARELLFVSVPAADPTGAPVGRLYLFRDVTHEREVARLKEEQRRLLEDELARASRVQAGLLPRGVPALPGFELAARCVPARAVGGDFFDWHEPLPGRLTLTLGDVMGKGMPAALLMATVRAALAAVASRLTPARAMRTAAAALERDLDRAESFVTLFLARADVASSRLTYVDAGHGLVFVRRAGGAVEGLRHGGLPLGVLPAQVYRAGSLTLHPGDALVVYSDGLSDARPDLALTPAAVAGHLAGAASAAEAVDRLVALATPGGPAPPALADDLTVVVLRRDPEP
jgi:PAS domain S-box-containing protein